ncbi:Protein fam72a, partial [Irineochytrium annulatum]
MRNNASSTASTATDHQLQDPAITSTGQLDRPDDSGRRRIIFSRAAQQQLREMNQQRRSTSAARSFNVSQYEFSVNGSLNPRYVSTGAGTGPSSEMAQQQTHQQQNGRVGSSNGAFQSVSSFNQGVHPSFRSKSVCLLNCRFCVQEICRRGMKAILLADTRVELYSTDT